MEKAESSMNSDLQRGEDGEVGSESTHHLTVPPGLNPDEFEELRPWAIEFHTYRVNSGQCSSLLAQRIHAPPDTVWSVVRQFDKPHTYKHFIKSCTVCEGFRMAVGDTRYVNVISGLPAATSTERLDILDDGRRVTGFSIIGGEHRLRNYRSVTSVHGLRRRDGGRSCTAVLESYVVDVPEGNTEEDTKLFADTVVKLNLQKLASITEGINQDRNNDANEEDSGNGDKEMLAWSDHFVQVLNNNDVGMIYGFIKCNSHKFET
nr:abscisic acid receptor PYR1-like [Ipomoea batatas]